LDQSAFEKVSKKGGNVYFAPLG